MHQPEVVILDEPTIGIDPRQVIEVRDAVQSLREHHTVLFSSHILSEIEQVCDRVIIINKGRIVGEGTPDSLSRQMSATQQIFIKIEGASSEAVIGKLKRIPQVQSIRPLEDGFLVVAKTKDDIRGTLSRMIASEGLILLEMRSLDSSLEDVFMTLTESGTP